MVPTVLYVLLCTLLYAAATSPHLFCKHCEESVDMSADIQEQNISVVDYYYKLRELAPTVNSKTINARELMSMVATMPPQPIACLSSAI